MVPPGRGRSRRSRFSKFSITGSPVTYAGGGGGSISKF
jgi:hypothetical protein